jgi:hypothetical protein
MSNEGHCVSCSRALNCLTLDGFRPPRYAFETYRAKPQTIGNPNSVPQGRLNLAQDASPGLESKDDQVP